MRIANRPLIAVNTTISAERISGTAIAARKAAFAADTFEAAPASGSRLKSAAKEALVNAGEQALGAVLSRLVDTLAQKLSAALDKWLARLMGGQQPAPQLPPGAPVEPGVPAAPPAPTTPTAPAVPANLAPTPLSREEKPGTVGYVNTIQNQTIAPRSQFRQVVNEAIDAVRARGEGIDPQDPNRITDYDTYHSGVVTELRRRGYNAAYDGEELAVGRANDSFSEQFDISTSTGLVRRFYIAWISPPVWA